MPIINFFGDIFNFFLLQPILNLFVLILNLLISLNIPGALGFSIISITILISIVTWRFKVQQIKHTRFMADKMQELKPRLQELKEKHKDDRLAFGQAQNELFKEHGVNPAAGCLPTLLQVLPLYPLYQIFLAFFQGEKGLHTINYFLYNESWHLKQLPSTDFFGVNLAAKPSEFQALGLSLLSIPLISALLTFIQSRMMMPSSTLKVYPSDSSKEVKEKEDIEDMMASMQPMMIYMMPVMIAVIAFQFPVGLAIYWNILTIIGIIQQYLISGWGGMALILNRLGLSVIDNKQIEYENKTPGVKSFKRSGTKVTIERIKKSK